MSARAVTPQDVVRALGADYEPPRVALVLGSGLSQLASVLQLDACWTYADLPGFAVPTALGHAGNLLCGRWSCRGAHAGLSVPIVAMQGRLHLYEGHSWTDVVFPIRVMYAMGARTLVLSNAAGGIDPRYRVGDIMMVRDHINLLFPRPQVTLMNLPAPGQPPQGMDHVDRSPRSTYDAELIRCAARMAGHLGHRLWEGTYAAVRGPNYETRAEYRLLRRLGADAVGMSTVPETLVAATLGMRVLAFSVITNVCSPDTLHSTSGPAVVQAAAQASDVLRDILAAVLGTLAAE